MIISFEGINTQEVRSRLIKWGRLLYRDEAAHKIVVNSEEMFGEVANLEVRHHQMYGSMTFIQLPSKELILVILHEDSAEATSEFFKILGLDLANRLLEQHALLYETLPA